MILIDERRIRVPTSHGILASDCLMAGEGSPLVLVHGLGDSAASWRRVILPLANRYRVYAPSLPGFGTSTTLAEGYSPAFFAAFVESLLDTLGLERAAVVGNSLGGLVAMRLALAAPTRVSALGLVDSAGLGRELNLALRLLTLPGMGALVSAWNRTTLGAWQWALGVAGMLLRHPTRAPGPWIGELYRMARRPGYLEATVATLRSESTFRGQRQREIMLDLLPRLTMPTLVIWGSHDRLLPPHHAQMAMGQLPKPGLVVIPGCGHVPHIERPEQFVAALHRFLAESDAAQPQMAPHLQSVFPGTERAVAASIPSQAEA